jgi:hypothetical protein
VRGGMEDGMKAKITVSLDGYSKNELKRMAKEELRENIDDQATWIVMQAIIAHRKERRDLEKSRGIACDPKPGSLE